MHLGHLLQRSSIRFRQNPLWHHAEGAMTYAQGCARIAQAANAFLSRAAPRDRVALLTSNRFEGLEAHLAATAAGMVAVPMNPRLRPKEHEFIIGDADARIVVFSAEFAGHLGGIRQNLPGVSHWICIGDTENGAESYEALFGAASPEFPEVAIEPSDIAWLFYTSGTTGRPKGAIETHRNLITMVEQFLLCVAPSANPQDVWLHAAPICHGSGTCMFPYLAIGASQAFLPRFEANAFVEAVASFGVTSTFLAPTMIARILASPQLVEADLRTLRAIIYGGGPMHLGLLRRAMKVLGPILTQIYGQGEAPFTISAMNAEEHVRNDRTGTAHRLGSAGRVTVGTRVEIQDDSGKSVPRGTNGEICVRGDLVMPGYWRNATASAETLSGGWLHTGDIGHLDDDDYLYILDRKKDFIISGGANIYSREVEEAICGHPAVAEAAVIGVPDDEWGESVKAFVVLQPGASLTEAEVIELCKVSLASYKKPRFVTFVTDLPKNATGKVLKRQLREESRVG